MQKILVVDDDKDILMIVRYILADGGYEVKTHSSGLGVYELIESYKPDLVLLDIWLPGKSGTEICSEIKKLGSSVKIVLFSAHTMPADALKLCNAEGFIQKPFDIDALFSTIKEHINGKKLED